MTPVNAHTTAPALSIVIAAHNAADTLAEQLGALVGQGGRSWEILVCDNGSTDGTRAVVADWSVRHPCIRLVDASARRGPAAARNIGVAAASGGDIAFCDADDVVGVGWADAIEDALRHHSFVAGRFEVDRLGSGSAFSISWSPQLEGLTRVPSMPGFLTAGAGNMAMHREVFESVSGFDERLLTAEDDDLCRRVQLQGHPLVYVEGMLLHVRRRAGLLPTFRQAVQYGTGERRLKHRYALLADEFRESPEHAPPMGMDRSPSAGIRSLGRWVLDRARGLGRPATMLTNVVWRMGWRIGWHRARINDVDQIRPAGPGPGTRASFPTTR